MKSVIVQIPFLLLAACGGQRKGFVVRGNVSGQEENAVVILSYPVDGETARDTAAIENGAFRFTGSVDEPVLAVLSLHTEEDIRSTHPVHYTHRLEVYLEDGVITVGEGQPFRNSPVTGTPTNSDMAAWKSLIEAESRELAKLREEEFEIVENEGFNRENPLFRENGRRQGELNRSIAAKAQDFFDANPDSYYTLHQLLPRFVRNNTPIERADSIFSRLSPRMRASAAGRKYTERFARQRALLPGNPAPEFTQPDVDGNPVRLLDFRGKYLLLDFWASWCGPCRNENKHVVAAYEKYRKRGFDVLGVSLDGTKTGKQEWIRAIEDDGLHWTNVSDLKGGQNEAARLYLVTAIPSNYLLDPDGIILGVNLRAEALFEALENYLNR